MSMPGIDTSGPSNVKQLLATYQTVKSQINSEDQKIVAIKNSNQPDALKQQQLKALHQRVIQLRQMMNIVSGRLSQMQKQSGMSRCVFFTFDALRVS